MSLTSLSRSSLAFRSLRPFAYFFNLNFFLHTSLSTPNPDSRLFLAFRPLISFSKSLFTGLIHTKVFKFGFLLRLLVLVVRVPRNIILMTEKKRRINLDFIFNNFVQFFSLVILSFHLYTSYLPFTKLLYYPWLLIWIYWITNIVLHTLGITGFVKLIHLTHLKLLIFDFVFVK